MDYKPKRVVESANLDSYKLNGRLKKLLLKADEYIAFCQSMGSKEVPVIRLFRRDILEIDRAVREQSSNKHSVHSVFFNGRKLIAHDE